MMKKTLIALSLLSVSGLAMADVVLYGQIRGGVEVTAGVKKAGQKVDGTVTQIKDFGSRIGFKGQEQLNGNLKAIWQLEQSVNIGGKSTGFGTRDSFIGLQGDFGKIRAGYMHNPIEMAGDLNYLWTGTGDILDNTSDLYTRRVGLDYTTPDLNGFQARVFVSPSDNNNNVGNVDAAGNAKPKHEKTANTPNDSAVYAASVAYKHGSGFFAGLAGGYVKGGVSNADYDINGKLKDAYQGYTQVGFENDKILAGVGYKYSRNVDTDPIGNEGSIRRSQDVLGAFNYRFNENLRLNTAVGYGWDYQTAARAKAWGNGKYITAGVGLDYNLSKRTEIKTGYGYLQAGNTANRYRSHTANVAIRHRF